MMKKLMILAMTLLLLTALMPVNAQAANLVDLPSEEADHIRQNAEVLQKSQNALERLLLGGDKADVVTIDEENGEYSVVTANGLKLEVTVPFGSVCITQDILQQLSLYSSLYTNINSAYEYYISKGIHLNVYNMLTYQDINVSANDDPLAKLVGNMNSLSESDLQYILSYVTMNWYKGSEGKITEINGQVYMEFDLREIGGYYLYETFAAGQDVCVYSFMAADDAEQAAELADLMENLVISENG